MHRDEEWPPLAATGESPSTETKTQHSNQPINQSINLKKIIIKIKNKLLLCSSTEIEGLLVTASDSLSYPDEYSPF